MSFPEESTLSGSSGTWLEAIRMALIERYASIIQAGHYNIHLNYQMRNVMTSRYMNAVCRSSSANVLWDSLIIMIPYYVNHTLSSYYGDPNFLWTQKSIFEYCEINEEDVIYSGMTDWTRLNSELATRRIYHMYKILKNLLWVYGYISETGSFINRYKEHSGFETDFFSEISAKLSSEPWIYASNNEQGQWNAHFFEHCRQEDEEQYAGVTHKSIQNPITKNWKLHSDDDYPYILGQSEGVYKRRVLNCPADVVRFAGKGEEPYNPNSDNYPTGFLPMPSIPVGETVHLIETLSEETLYTSSIQNPTDSMISEGVLEPPPPYVTLWHDYDSVETLCAINYMNTFRIMAVYKMENIYEYI